MAMVVNKHDFCGGMCTAVSRAQKEDKNRGVDMKQESDMLSYSFVKLFSCGCLGGKLTQTEVVDFCRFML